MRASVKISVGIDSGGTSSEGLSDLLESLGAQGELWVFHNANSSTFHPKVYLFKNDAEAELVIGSGNLTEGGLYTNYEVGTKLNLDLSIDADRSLLNSIESELNSWSSEQEGLCYRLDPSVIQHLIDDEDLPNEANSWETEERSGQSSRGQGKSSIFTRTPVQGAPTRKKTQTDVDLHGTPEVTEEIENDSKIPSSSSVHHSIFVMTLHKTDVGHGQTTAGKSRRSPEIFIPLAARNEHPDFWEWPGGFIPDASNPGKMDRFGVEMRLSGGIIHVNMMTWPAKHDFRLRSESIRSAGNIGDILYMERVEGQAYKYYLEIIPLGSKRYHEIISFCTNRVRNSGRVWGYL